MPDDPPIHWSPAATWPGPDRTAIDVWQCPLHLARPLLAARREVLDAAERARAARFHRDVDHNAYVSARGFLRERLSAYLGTSPERIELTASSHGKPTLAAPEPRWEFNVSHSGDLALVAIAWNRPVGIDLELIRGDMDGPALARQFFSPAEIGALGTAPADERTRWFFTIWTRKESFLKAKGTGLSFPLDRFSVTASPHEEARLVELAEDHDPSSRWRMWDLPVGPDYAATLSAAGNQAALVRGWR